MPFADALATYLKLLDATDVASKALQKYPKGPMGLTPDAVKSSTEFQADRNAYLRADANLKKFAKGFFKLYKKEYEAWYRAQRDAKRQAALAK